MPHKYTQFEPLIHAYTYVLPLLNALSLISLRACALALSSCRLRAYAWPSPGGWGVGGTPRKEAVRRPSPNTRLYCKFPECRTLAPTNFSLESHEYPAQNFSHLNFLSPTSISLEPTLPHRLLLLLGIYLDCPLIASQRAKNADQGGRCRYKIKAS